MVKSSGLNIEFRKQDSLGVSAAEDDAAFLFNCFIETGDYDSVVNLNDPKCLILGRTGVGKTALVSKLLKDKKERVIVINPESLAMRHISNSTIIRYLHELDIDLNTFFKLLWRHEICVQIFVRHFKVVSDSDGEKTIEKIRYLFKKKNPRNLRSLDYLQNWKDTFWQESESHVVSMVSRTETEVGGVLGGTASGLSAKLTGAKKLTEEEELKIRQKGQNIVNSVQMQEVAGLLEMLNDVIEFEQKQYYIVLDRLDESWVDDGLRYRLIKSLIETVKDLNRFENIKPIVALRVDLLGHVFDVTNDTGFQEEKYSSLYLNVNWSRNQLIELVNKRVNHLLESRYQKRKILTHSDILPEYISGEPAIDYIIDRTLMRPRDVIDFFNTFIQYAVGNSIIEETVIISAEKEYSKKRLKSLYFEWFTDFRNIKYWVRLIKSTEPQILMDNYSLDELKDMCLDYAVNYPLQIPGQVDRILDLAERVNNGKTSIVEFRKRLFHIFYQIGLLGIDEDQRTYWSYDRSYVLDWEDLEDDTFLSIHPCFKSALKTKKP